MRFIILTLSFLVFMGCVTNQKNSSKFKPQAFEVEEATVAHWFGGQPGVKGSNYTLTLKPKLKGKFSYDSIFIENSWHPIKVDSEKPNTITVNINKPEFEQVEISENSDYVDVTIVSPNETQSEVKDFKDKNVLKFKIDKKSFFFELPKFKEKDNSFFP